VNAQRVVIAIVGAGLALSAPAVLAATGAPSQSGGNLQQAIQHTQQAIQAGQQKNPSSFVEHADNAIDSAMQAEKGGAKRPRVEAGVQQLREAIRTAQGTHSERRVQAAVRRAQTALSDFQSAQPGQR
jgi:hypothetical protein